MLLSTVKSDQMAYTVQNKVSIRNINDVYSELLRFVDDNQEIEIDLEICEDLDLSLIQLIESARKTAAAESKIIRLTKPANEAVLSTLHRAGLVEGFSANDTKFWLHKEIL